MRRAGWLRMLAAVLSGVILTFAFPRWKIEAAVWLWIYPLLAVLWLTELTKRQALFTGWIAGLSFFLPNLCWVHHSSRVINGAVGNEWMGFGVEAMGWGAAFGLSGFLALYVAVWAVFTHTIARPYRAVLLHGNWLDVSLDSLRASALSAGAWVALEWVRGWLLTGFGWNGLGVGLHRNLVLIQSADIIGVCGLAFLPVFGSCVLFNVVHRLVLRARTGGGFRYHFDAMVAMLVLTAQVMYGLHRLNEAPGERLPVRVALVQPNVRQVDIFSRRGLPERYRRYAELTRMYAVARNGVTPVDLVVWPESALGLPYEFPEHEPYFNELLAAGDYSLMAGCDVGDHENPPSYTSVLLARGKWSQNQLYHKVHLVPFGEYLPMRWLLGPVLGGVLPGDFAFGPKTEPLLLAKPKAQIIPLICFEDTVGSLAAKFVRDEPQLMVNVTNDGWFLESDEPEQQAANAIFRCVELRRPMVRSCNTGLTCFIDDRGHVTSALRDPETGSCFLEGVLPGTAHVPMKPERTIYARWGDWFAVLWSVVCLVRLAQPLMARFRKRA